MDKQNSQQVQYFQYDPQQKNTKQATTILNQEDDSDEEYYQDQNRFIPNLNFNSLQSANKTTVRLGAYDPKYKHKVVIPGLSLKGICRNPYCRVNNLSVWIRVGYTQFEMTEQIYESECPICHQFVEPSSITTLGYRQAKITIKGKKILHNNKPQVFKFQDTESVGKFTKFLQNDSSNIKWSRMTVKVEKI